MTDFTCTITYPGGERKTVWTPRKPTPALPCNTGDTVTFKSPNVKSGLSFGTDSPFEANAGAKIYQVPKGGSLKLTINPRAKQTNLGFDCMPNDVLIPGAGDEVPVGTP